MVCAWAFTGCADEPDAPPLPRLKMDPDRIAVVGFSSGAAMAHQLHLAYSDRIGGAFLLSGPPYQCARGSLDVALSDCMKSPAAPPDARALAARVVERARGGKLAPLEGLAGDRAAVVHGVQDTLVGESVARAAHDVYAALPNAAAFELRWDGAGSFAHVWPTAGQGGDCSATVPPYQAACGRDLAGDAMQFLFGASPAPVAASATGTLQRFRTPVAPADEGSQLDGTLYLYRPTACTGTQACALAVVLHGCEQSASVVGETFVRDAGFNRWADALGVVVLYPQVKASYVPLNPKGCWDWWGYTGEDYDTRDGAQLRAVMHVVEALGLPVR